MKPLFFIIVLFTIPFAKAFATNCSITLATTSIVANYTGPELNSFFSASVTRASNGSNNSNCARVALFFSRGNANSYTRMAFNSSNTIFYQLENTAPTAVLKGYGDTSSSNEFLYSNISRGQTLQMQGKFKIPAQNINTILKGQYQDIITVSLYLYKNNGSFEFVTSKQMNIYITVPVQMSLSLLPEGGVFDENSTMKTVDFGAMTANQELGADLVVKSNAPYYVQLSSGNNGQLKHLTANSFVPYRFTFAANTVDLSASSGSPVTVVTRNTLSNSAGDRYNMRIRILNVTDKLSGNYQDYIVVQISSL